MDHQQLQHNIIPKKVQSTACGSHAVHARIVHGGQWVAVLYGDGTLHLREPGSDIPSVVDDTFKAIVDDFGANDGMNMSLSLSDSNDTLLLLTIFCSSNAFYSTIFTVYRIDTDGPGFCLLMPPQKRTHERYEGSPVVTGKLWAFAWWQGTRRLLAVGSISSSQRQDVVMDIGAFKFQGTISILSEKQILLSSRAGMLLFDIPDLQPASEPASIIRVRPAWTHGFESLDVYMYPNTSPPERGEGANIAVLNGYNLCVFHPAEDIHRPSECRVTSYKLQTHDAARVHARNCLSSRRVFFCKDNMIHTCIIPSERDDLQQTGQPSSESPSIRATSIKVDEARVGEKLRVQDISWDETSGRLCLLAGQHHDCETSQGFPLRIIVVDF